MAAECITGSHCPPGLLQQGQAQHGLLYPHPFTSEATAQAQVGRTLATSACRWGRGKYCLEPRGGGRDLPPKFWLHHCGNTVGELPNAVGCGATQRLTLQNQEGGVIRFTQ